MNIFIRNISIISQPIIIYVSVTSSNDKVKHIKRLSDTLNSLFPNDSNETLYEYYFEKNLFKTAAAENYLSIN